MRAAGTQVDIVFVTGDAYVDHPSFAMALLGPIAGRRRLSRGDFQPARLALCEAVAHVRQAAAVFRHQRRQHGFDDQPLHGQPQSAQRRCLQPRRTHRPAARSRHAGLLPARPRGVQRRAGHRRRRRGQLATAGALRLLERQGPPLDRARLQVPICWCTAWASGRSSKSPTDLPPAQRCATCADLRGVAYRLGARSRISARR